MYLPPHFTQTDQEEISAFIDTHPFATVIAVVNGEMWPTQIPLFRRGEDTLIGHVARGNDMWHHDLSQNALIIFSGPDTYITPNWYPTKQLNHKTVPTWNYTSVNIWAEMTIHDETRWKRMAVGKLTNIHERTNAQPWKMGDAPQDYLEGQLELIVGIEFTIKRLEAKWKLNQNRTVEDRHGVIAGLTERDTGADADIATMMRTTLDDNAR